MTVTISILLGYFALMLFVAWYAAKNDSLEAYYLNKRQTSLWMMTFSNVATVVGAWATIAIVSEVYNSGISYGIILPITFVIGMVIFGIVAKKIRVEGEKYDAYSLVDFFTKRFDNKNTLLLNISQIFLVVIWLAVQLLGIATLFHTLLWINTVVAIVVSLLVVSLYTTFGGLRADIVTDFIQFWIILIVFIVMSVYGYIHVWWFTVLFSQIPPTHLNPLWFWWMSFFVGAILFSGFIYLSNSAHWQRILSAKNEIVARKSFFYSIPFMILISGMVLFFGLYATVLLPNINQDTAIFALIYKILPPWLVWIGYASLLAVVMSSVDSLLIGGSTIVYKIFFKKNQFERKKEVLYAKGMTLSLAIIGGIIAFMVPEIITLWLFVSYLTLLFVPAIFAWLYSKKISSNASFYSMLVPMLLLVILFPFLEKNTFLVNTPLSILIILLYDKIDWTMRIK